MSKVIDITEKLNFEENPKLKIKDETVEVNSDATTVLKIMGVLGNGEDPTPKDLLEMYQLLFSEKDRQTLQKLNLKMKDLTVIIQQAISLVVGETEHAGE